MKTNRHFCMLLTFIAAAALPFIAAHAQHASSQSEALNAWDQIHGVLTHPRCVNCHVGDDNRPRWSGQAYGLKPGEFKAHGMNIDAGQSRIGAETISCDTCHQSENGDLPHSPPGSHLWALAPLSAQWLGVSPAKICAQLKDPARNGGRDMAELIHHMEAEPLVIWGWNPGPGRQTPAISHDEFVSYVKVWAAAGAPCPASQE